MQVILLRDIPGVGQKGSIKSVSDGYALNALIPKRMAELATPEKIRAHEKEIAQLKAEHEMQEKEWSVLVKKLDGKSIELKRNASPQGHLYEKVSGEDVRVIIEKEFKVQLPPHSVNPKIAIKQTGDSPVEIKLGSHVANLIVKITA